MGNYIDKSLLRRSDEVRNYDKDNATIVNASTHEEEVGENINYHIYSYKQQIHHKEQQILKWAMAKLALTDELIRANVQRDSSAEDAAHYETDGYLTDDEMDDTADQELTHLESYRTKLLDIIVLLKRSNVRKKGKRFKRRRPHPKLSAVFAKAKLSGIHVRKPSCF